MSVFAVSLANALSIMLILLCAVLTAAHAYADESVKERARNAIIGVSWHGLCHEMTRRGLK